MQLNNVYTPEMIIQCIDEVIAGTTERGRNMWQALLEMHPADNAHILANISDADLARLFVKFSQPKQL